MEIRSLLIFFYYSYFQALKNIITCPPQPTKQPNPNPTKKASYCPPSSYLAASLGYHSNPVASGHWWKAGRRMEGVTYTLVKARLKPRLPQRYKNDIVIRWHTQKNNHETTKKQTTESASLIFINLAIASLISPHLNTTFRGISGGHGNSSCANMMHLGHLFANSTPSNTASRVRRMGSGTTFKVSNLGKLKLPMKEPSHLTYPLHSPANICKWCLMLGIWNASVRFGRGGF